MIERVKGEILLRTGASDFLSEVRRTLDVTEMLYSGEEEWPPAVMFKGEQYLRTDDGGVTTAGTLQARIYLRIIDVTLEE